MGKRPATLPLRLAVLLAVLGAPCLRALEPGRPLLRHFTAEDYGGGDPAVYSVAQDARGVMYFGVNGTVLEYDGATWRRLPVPDGGAVRGLAFDRQDRLWVAAEQALGVFEPVVTGERSFTRLVPPGPERRHIGVHALGPAVWFAHAKGLLCWEGGAWSVFDMEWSAPARFQRDPQGRLLLFAWGQACYELTATAPVPLWPAPGLDSLVQLFWPEPGGADWMLLTENAGLWRWQDGRAERLPVELPGQVGAALRLADGRLAVFARRHGVLVFDSALEPHVLLGETAGLLAEECHAMFEDRSGRLWVCTERGITLWDARWPVRVVDRRDGLRPPPESRLPVTRNQAGEISVGAPARPMALTQPRLLALEVARAGRTVLVRTPYGIYRHNPSTGLFRHENEWGQFVGMTAGAGGVWLQEEERVSRWCEDLPGPVEAWPGRSLALAAEPGGERLLLATPTGLRLLQTAPSGWKVTAEAEVTIGRGEELLWPAPETAWLRTREGLRRVQVGPAGLKLHEVIATGASGETSVQLLAHQGTLFVVDAAGLRRWDGKAERFVADPRLAGWPQGLSPTRATMDAAGGLWFITRTRPGGGAATAVWRIAPDGARWQLPAFLLEQIGRPWNLIGEPGGSRLWLVGHNGLACLEPAVWADFVREEIFPVLIREAGPEGRPSWTPGRRARVVAGGAPLRFAFAGVHHPVFGQVEYQTWLEGHDAGWTQWRTEPLREFGGLPVGEYRFRVRARAGAATGREAAWDFSVVPPWWRTWPALAGYGLLLASGVAGLVRWRGRAARRRTLELEREVAARTAELRAGEENLRQARDAAEASNRAKSAFLAHMSHELRTPLNGILGYTQLMARDRSLDTAQRERLRVIGESGRHLLRLINDVLDLSKIEAGRVELHPRTCDLPALLGSVADLFRPRAAEQRLAFNVELDPGLPANVELDDGRLTQVLVNLLGNAFKFTRHGTVTLTAASTPDGRTRFEVRDTGRGIGVEDRERIFRPFEQAGADAARQGTGLGLAISRRLVALLGGELRVESEPGRGSCFWFELRLSEVPRAASVVSAADRVTGYAGARRRVLVVDDLAVNREVLTGLLVPLGFEVREAADGEAALRVAAEFDPHLVLLDLRMAPMDGFAVASSLRADPARAAAKIVAVSASAFDFDRGDAQRAGCDGFLAKPFLEEELLAEVQQQLGLEWRREAPPAATPPGVRPEPPVLEELRTLAMAGRIPRLRRRIATLRAERPEWAGFLDELDALAAKFDLTGLAARLAP